MISGCPFRAKKSATRRAVTHVDAWDHHGTKAPSQARGSLTQIWKCDPRIESSVHATHTTGLFCVTDHLCHRGANVGSFCCKGTAWFPDNLCGPRLFVVGFVRRIAAESLRHRRNHVRTVSLTGFSRGNRTAKTCLEYHLGSLASCDSASGSGFGSTRSGGNRDSHARSDREFRDRCR